jgi:hypothetical protein
VSRRPKPSQLATSLLEWDAKAQLAVRAQIALLTSNFGRGTSGMARCWAGRIAVTQHITGPSARLVASCDESIGTAAFWADLRSAPPSRSRLGEATRVDAVSAQCAGVAGWMFLLLWNTLSGSYLAFTSTSRR